MTFKEEMLFSSKRNVKNQVKVSISKILSKLQNDDFFDKNENKINYLHDIYSAPNIKNRLFKDKNYNESQKLNLLYIDKLRDKIIFPNNFNKSTNMHVNGLKRDYQEKRDLHIFKNRNSHMDIRYKVDYTFKHLKENTIKKFDNLKGFYNSHKYFNEKYTNYEPKIDFLNENNKKIFSELIVNLNIMPN